MAPKPSKRKHVTLSISDKMKMIEKSEKGATVTSLASEYGVGVSTVKDIIRKNKEKIKAYCTKYDISGKNRGVVIERKNIKYPSKPELDYAIFKWCEQQIRSGVMCRGVDIRAAAKRLAELMNVKNFNATTGWLTTFCRRYGLKNKKLFRECEIVDEHSMEPFCRQLKEIMEKEGLKLWHLYNLDETGLFWNSLPKSTQIFNDEGNLKGEKDRKKISALFCANADGSHRLKSVIVGKCAFKDMGYKLPVHYYYNNNVRFTADIICDWFHKYLEAEIRRFQMQEKRVLAEDVKAIILMDNAPCHSTGNKLCSRDGKIKALFISPNQISVLQPMNQGILMTIKRLYKKRFLEEVLVVLEDDELKDTRCQKTVSNLKSYSLKDTIYNWACACNDVNATTLQNSWLKILNDEDPELDFDGLEPEDYVRILRRAGVNGVTEADVEDWLEEDEGDPGKEMLSEREIADSIIKVSTGDVSGNKESGVGKPAKLSHIRNCMDSVLQFINMTDDSYVKAYYDSFRTFREYIIHRQHQTEKQITSDSFFAPPYRSVSCELQPCTSSAIPLPSPSSSPGSRSDTSCIQDSQQVVSAMEEIIFIKSEPQWQIEDNHKVQNKMEVVLQENVDIEECNTCQGVVKEEGDGLFTEGPHEMRNLR